MYCVRDKNGFSFLLIRIRITETGPEPGSHNSCNNRETGDKRSRGNKMKNKAIFITLIIMLMAGLVMMTGCSGQTEEVPDEEQQEEETSYETEITDPAGFEAYTADGEAFTQEDFASYDLTMINAWATYCPPCRDEMSSIAVLEKKLPDNICLALMCLDAEQEQDEMESILEKADYTGINWVNGNDGYFGMFREIRYIPTNIFIDSDGHVVDVMVGGAGVGAEEVLRDRINSLLKEMGKDEI